MRKNIKTKRKESTNVKQKKNDPPSGKRLFDAKKAKLIRDESRWDAFQLVGESNREEMEHVSQLRRKMSERELQKVLDRGLAFRMGRKINMILNTETR